MLAIIIALVISAIVSIIVLYKHTEELQELVYKIEKAYNLTNRFGQTLTEVKKGADQINQIDEDLTKMVEVFHDNFRALDLQFGEMKNLFLLGNTSLELKEIIAAQPERIFDGNAFVHKFLARAKTIAEKYKAKKQQKKKFKSLYSKSLVEPDNTRGELLEEHH